MPKMASSTDHWSLIVSSNLTFTMKTLFIEKGISLRQESEMLLEPRVGDTLTRIFGHFQGGEWLSLDRRSVHI